MSNFFKREYLVVIIIVALAAAVGLFSVSNRPELIINYPENYCLLEDADFVLTIANEQLIIGTSTWDDVTRLIPDGHILGLSTIYRPNSLGCLFTFTKEENILHKVHITADLSTSRGVKPGDSMKQVVNSYGKDYASVFESGKQENLDMVYGNDNNNSIVFQIRNYKVNKIILQKG